MYAVAVLAEQALSPLDAEQVVGLHTGLDEPVRYHVLVAGDAAASQAAAELLERATRSRSGQGVAESSEHDSPVDAVVDVAERNGAAEVIVLTGSHPLREAVHRDWTSQVRARLSLPTLHLLEHESFGEQSAGLGEGNQVL